MTVENLPLKSDSLLGTRLDERKLTEFKEYVIQAVERAEPGLEPFRSLFIEHIFPEELHKAIKARMFQHKYNSTLIDRTQDSEKFVNKRFSLVQNEDVETQYIRAIFSDNAVKATLLRKFYLDVTPSLIDSLQIHEEFEYVYTAAGQFQNIHIDIPPKFLSFVFYFPEFEVGEDAELKNATVFYDRSLEPHYVSRYRPNSVGIFAPHFYSYHGFSSTIDRQVLVMFYVSPTEMDHWVKTRGVEAPPFEAIRSVVSRKLEHYPLIEYGRDPVARKIEHDACLVNAPRGRVMRENQ